eukprot:301483_1
MSDEEVELVDPKIVIDKECMITKCKAQVREYEDCGPRLKIDKTGRKHCFGYHMDMWYCIDHCGAKKLFFTAQVKHLNTKYLNRSRCTMSCTGLWKCVAFYNKFHVQS